MKISHAAGFAALALCAALMGTGCASSQKKFDSITPGMTTSDVRNSMDGPSRFEAVPDTEYASWYWNDDYCVLFKGDKVVGKDSAHVGKSVSVGPGQYEERHVAQCLAPGQTASSGSERTVNIPGIGTIRLPKGSFTSDQG